jgi:hypothetical protein
MGVPHRNHACGKAGANGLKCFGQTVKFPRFLKWWVDQHKTAFCCFGGEECTQALIRIALMHAYVGLACKQAVQCPFVHRMFFAADQLVLWA